MSLYGPTSVARALQSEHGGNVDDKFLEKKGVLGTLLRPPAWTRACAWKPGGACSRASEGDGLDNGRNSTVCDSSAYILRCTRPERCVYRLYHHSVRHISTCGPEQVLLLHLPCTAMYMQGTFLITTLYCAYLTLLFNRCRTGAV